MLLITSEADEGIVLKIYSLWIMYHFMFGNLYYLYMHVCNRIKWSAQATWGQSFDVLVACVRRGKEAAQGGASSGQMILKIKFLHLQLYSYTIYNTLHGGASNTCSKTNKGGCAKLQKLVLRKNRAGHKDQCQSHWDSLLGMVQR